MAKTLIYNVINPTANIAPSASPGALLAPYGITDYSGTAGTNASGQFYFGSVNSTNVGIQFTNAPSGGAALPSLLNGGQLELDCFITPGSPVSGTNGSIFLWMGSTLASPTFGGLCLAFDERGGNVSSVNVGAGGGAVLAVYRDRSHTWTTWASQRLILRAAPAGVGPNGNKFHHMAYEVWDIGSSTLVQSGFGLWDSRYPQAGGSPWEGGGGGTWGNTCGVSGDFGSWNQSKIYAFDATGALAFIDQPWSDWQSHDTLRVVSPIAMGGTAPYTYQYQYRVHSTGSFVNVPTSGIMTGTSPVTVIQGLSPSTSYDVKLIVTDAALATITSTTLVVSTIATAPNAVAVFMVGDSITANPGNIDSGWDRGTALLDAYNAVGIATTDRFLYPAAVGGADASLLSTYTPYVKQMIQELRPSYIDVMVGTNDAGHGPPGDTGTVFQGHIDSMRADFNTATPNTRCVFHIPSFRALNTPFTPLTQDNVLLSVDYVTSISNLHTAHPSLCYLGDQQWFQDSYNNAVSGGSTYYADQIHPSKLGYSILGPDEVTRMQILFPTWFAPVIDLIAFTPNPCNLEVGMVRKLTMHCTLAGVPATGQVITFVSNNTGVCTLAAGNATTDGSGNCSVEVTCTGTVGNTTTITATNGAYSNSVNVAIQSQLSGGGGGGSFTFS